MGGNGGKKEGLGVRMGEESGEKRNVASKKM